MNVYVAVYWLGLKYCLRYMVFTGQERVGYKIEILKVTRNYSCLMNPVEQEYEAA